MDRQSHEKISMSDRVILAAYLNKTSPGFRDHDGLRLMLMNGRWGTCGYCPQHSDGIHPELCENTDRYDHNIHSTRDGKFYEYGKEIERSRLV